MLRGNRVSQQPGKVQNQLVADGVAEAVVDAFQVVHVKDDTGGRSFDEFHIVEQLFALALVRQSRVKVDVGFLFQLAVGTGNFDCGNRFIETFSHSLIKGVLFDCLFEKNSNFFQ